MPTARDRPAIRVASGLRPAATLPSGGRHEPGLRFPQGAVRPILSRPASLVAVPFSAGARPLARTPRTIPRARPATAATEQRAAAHPSGGRDLPLGLRPLHGARPRARRPALHRRCDASGGGIWAKKKAAGPDPSGRNAQREAEAFSFGGHRLPSLYREAEAAMRILEKR